MAHTLRIDLGTNVTTAAVAREGHVEMAPVGSSSVSMRTVIHVDAAGTSASRGAPVVPHRGLRHRRFEDLIRRETIIDAAATSGRS